MRLIPVLLFASSALLAQGVAAQARIFCCTDDKGTRVCGDFLPPACQGRAYEERDGKGFIAKQVEAPLTPEQQAKREAETPRRPRTRRRPPRSAAAIWRCWRPTPAKRISLRSRSCIGRTREESKAIAGAA
jgi:hypothetical protein